MKNIFTVTILFSFLAVALLFSTDSIAGFGPWAKKHTAIKPVNGLVHIPTQKINDGKAHYFSYKVQGKTIKFFVLKSRDGVIRAAFDACDVCFPKRKGYTQAGDYMICNNCGQKFHSTKINVLKGGCNPAPLRRTNKGQDLVITVADIQTGSRYF